MLIMWTILGNGEELRHLNHQEDWLKTVVSRGRIPPTIADDFFSLDQYNNATLYVPKGAMQAYIEAPGWRYFYNIVEGMPTGISQVESADNGMAVTADNGCIVISNAHGLVNVYDVSGILINSANADSTDIRITVPGHGIYIVKAGGRRQNTESGDVKRMHNINLFNKNILKLWQTKIYTTFQIMHHKQHLGYIAEWQQRSQVGR